MDGQIDRYRQIDRLIDQWADKHAHIDRIRWSDRWTEKWKNSLLHKTAVTLVSCPSCVHPSLTLERDNVMSELTADKMTEAIGARSLFPFSFSLPQTTCTLNKVTYFWFLKLKSCLMSLYFTINNLYFDIFIYFIFLYFDIFFLFFHSLMLSNQHLFLLIVMGVGDREQDATLEQGNR